MWIDAPAMQTSARVAPSVGGAGAPCTADGSPAPRAVARARRDLFELLPLYPVPARLDLVAPAAALLAAWRARPDRTRARALAQLLAALVVSPCAARLLLEPTDADP